MQYLKRQQVYQVSLGLNRPPTNLKPVQMSKLYGQLFDLGYREMPEEMYMK